MSNSNPLQETRWLGVLASVLLWTSVGVFVYLKLEPKSQTDPGLEARIKTLESLLPPVALTIASDALDARIKRLEGLTATVAPTTRVDALDVRIKNLEAVTPTVAATTSVDALRARIEKLEKRH